MKKFVILSAVAALALPLAANAADPVKKEAAPAAAAAAPAAGVKKIELKDGAWAQVEANGEVKVSKDGGKTWSAAPDGTWEAKDGSKITTKGGKAL